MTREEMIKEVINMDIESCEDCKLKDKCNKYELFWACMVWEEEMAEDL